jgi:ATP-dependent helicase/DNAse subunit B
MIFQMSNLYKQLTNHQPWTYTTVMSIKLEEYTLPEHLSYSAFTTYLTCGYQYYLGRLLNKQESPSVWSVGGSAFHLACENYDKENM